MKYTIEYGKEMTQDRLAKILRQFQTKDLPRLKKLKRYYDGKHNITYKTPTDVGKPCNKIVVNYCKSIVDNYSGYLTGKPISYIGNGQDEIMDVLNYTDIHTVDAELLKDALIYGIAYNINYIDTDGKQRIKTLNPQECIPVYDDTLNSELTYVVRFWRNEPINKDTETYTVEVYGQNSVNVYNSVAGFTSFELLEEVPNYYGQVQISPFNLNSDNAGIFEQVISLNDAYNSLVSGGIDSWDAFADAYLILKGVTADTEDLKNMKENRCILLDNDADAQYLTKSMSDTNVKDMLDNIDKKIHLISQSPDFSDDAFGTASGIALQYKLLDFENASAAIESEMKKVLQRRIELICNILYLTDTERTWRDIEIVFHRNLPVDIQGLAQIVLSLKGIVSSETLLGLLPFVKDPVAEAKKMEDEAMRNYNLYSFNQPEEKKQEDDE